MTHQRTWSNLACLPHLLRQDLIYKRLIGQALFFGCPAQPTQDLRIQPDGDQLSWLISQGRPPYAAHTGVAAKGAPIRRLLSRGTPLPLFFLLSFLIRLSRDKLIRAPVFSLLVSDMVRTSHTSGSRLCKCSLRNHLPAPGNRLPQKTVGTTPCPRFKDAQILWLPMLGSNP